MAKLLFVFLFMSLTLFDISELASFVCRYQYYEFEPLGEVYYCWIQNYVDIYIPEEAFIDSESGIHKDDHSNEVVVGLWLERGIMHYLPQNLTAVYPNLKAIVIIDSGIEELQQADIKTIPKLEHLALTVNFIEVLENGLFDYNPELKYINLNYNQIHSIGAHVFENLKGLDFLNLDGNICISSKDYVRYMFDGDEPPPLEEAKENALKKCNGSVFFELRDKFDNLINESENLNMEDFKIRYEKLKIELENSKYKESKALNEQLNYLKYDLETRIENSQVEDNSKNENDSTNNETENILDQKKLDKAMNNIVMGLMGLFFNTTLNNEK